MMRFLKRLLITIVVLFAALLAVIHFSVLSDDPALAASEPPSPEDVKEVRQFVRDLRTNLGSDAAVVPPTLLSEAQLNSASRMGSRFVKDVRGRFEVDETAVHGQFSVPVPWITGRKWVNLSGSVPEFENGFEAEGIKVGGMALPSWLAIRLARTGGNLVLGNGNGDRIIDAPQRMDIEGDTVAIQLELSEMGKNGVMRSVFGSLRGQDMPMPEQILDYERAILSAMRSGELKEDGSFLPYLKFTLQLAYDTSTENDLPNTYTAAMFALTKVCGAQNITTVISGIAADIRESDEFADISCDKVRLNGRTDTRLHFLTSAALRAASNRGFTISVGEFKELYDTTSGKSGFDFTDLAANNSGVRLSDYVMATPRSEWPAVLEDISEESQFIIDFDDIPGRMPQEEFNDLYGDVDSDAYKAQLAVIEDRIDRLDLYRP